MARNAGQKQARYVRRRSGGGYLTIALIAGGALAAAILAGDSIRSSLGLAPEPGNLGSKPTESQQASGSSSERTLALQPRGDALQVEITQTPVAQKELAPKPDVKAPIKAPTQVDGKVAELLQQARKAYTSFEWDAARTASKRLLKLKPNPETTVAAEDILRGADALEDIFTKLNTKDELSRGWDTHPLLVEITSQGRSSQVIPVLSMSDLSTPETDDPVGWMENRLASKGEVAVVLTSGGATTLRKGEITTIAEADLTVAIAEKNDAFNDKVTKASDGDFANDPLMWYEAAKFAYKNRLDARVTEMLDKALELDPFLATSIREDKAQGIFLKIVQQLEKGNKTSAAVWKKQLDKHYQETSVYGQAVAYYNGNMSQLRQAREQARSKRQQQREKALAVQRQRAEKLNDERAQAQLAKAEAAAKQDTFEPEPPTRAAQPLSGGSSEADKEMAAGMEIYQRALSMGVTNERDVLYKKAQGYFDKAMRLYEAAGDTTKMVKANQLRYACIKYRRTF